MSRVFRASEAHKVSRVFRASEAHKVSRVFRASEARKANRGSKAKVAYRVSGACADLKGLEACLGLKEREEVPELVASVDRQGLKGREGVPELVALPDRRGLREAQHLISPASIRMCRTQRLPSSAMVGSFAPVSASQKWRSLLHSTALKEEAALPLHSRVSAGGKLSLLAMTDSQT